VKKKTLIKRNVKKSQQKKGKSGQKSSKAAPEEALGNAIVFPKKLSVKPKSVIVVYGMRIEPEHIMKAAIEAYNKRRYTVHDIRMQEYVTDPKFRNLMVKIALLDRIEEEMLRIYPDTNIIRPNTVTLMVR
jgi:hypothetical protein